MISSQRRPGIVAIALVTALVATGCGTTGEPVPASVDAPQPEGGTFSQNDVVRQAEGFFGEGAEGVARLVRKAFKDLGEPNAYIKGQEAGGAVAVGLRYGEGVMATADDYTQKVYWQGPSLGFDVGGNAVKTFMLIYDLPAATAIYGRRMPGVEGSLYVIGGAGINYYRRQGITVAPIRVGVGWRAGASASYIKFTEEKTWQPF